MYSLRRTLSVRFSATLFAALLLIAAWAFFGARRLLREQLDRDLAADAQLELTFLRAGFSLHPNPDPLTWDEFVDRVNRFVVGRDRAGRIVASTTPLADDLPLDPDAFSRAAAGTLVWTTGPWLGQRIRSLYVPVTIQRPEGAVVVQIAASYGPFNRTSNELLLVMLGTVLLGTLATSLGARWLADSSIEPVLAITAQAEAVQPARPGQRITAHADITELAGLVRVINRMIGRLESAFEAQRHMIANAGHDLRTPLTAMQGQIEVALRSTRSSETYQDTLRNLLEEVEHLGALSDSLILLARLDTKQLRPDLHETDVRALIERSIRHAQARSPTRRFEFIPGADVLAQVDDHMLALVADHLLDNTIKHTPEGTQVTVSLEVAAGRWILTVVDDGPGLADDLLLILFQRFVRGDAARTRGGAGLGLSISAAIIEAHGGTVSAERSPPRVRGVRGVRGERGVRGGRGGRGGLMIRAAVPLQGSS